MYGCIYARSYWPQFKGAPSISILVSNQTVHTLETVDFLPRANKYYFISPVLFHMILYVSNDFI